MGALKLTLDKRKKKLRIELVFCRKKLIVK